MGNVYLEELGNQIRKLRKSKGLSQEQLALSAGVDRSYIGGIERGERNVSLYLLQGNLHFIILIMYSMSESPLNNNQVHFITMVDFYKRAWKNQFESILARTKHELIITSPYIKTTEAELICNNFLKRRVLDTIRFTLLTDLKAQSILDNSLDIDALQLFQSRIANFELITLPRLHAKVYIFDGKYAVVGSSNLTTSGLEYNYEYNVGLKDKRSVQKIQSDISDYSVLGNRIEKSQLDELTTIAADIQCEYQKVTNSTTREVQRKFRETIKNANTKFIEAFVGKKSAYSIFKETIVYCLSKESLSTKELQTKVQQMLPDLCIDEELVINGQRFGQRWKHQVRTVLNDLRRRENLSSENKIWHFKK